MKLTHYRRERPLDTAGWSGVASVIENHSHCEPARPDVNMDSTSTVLPYFLYSSGILFREGLEALLVIIALVAGTREAGQSNRARDIYAGAIIAVLVSIGLAWMVNDLIGDNASDTLEAIFQIFAAATLFYVSSWITSKMQAERWHRFIRSKVEAARRSRGPSIALGLTAFLAVMREGAETIVFFQALADGATATAERHAVFAGVIVGALALAITFAALNYLAFKIPIRPFFSVTSILLYALAVIFVGQGVSSFQESGWLSATFVNYVPTIQVLGLFPTVQTLVAQGALLLLAAVAIFMPFLRRVRVVAESAPASTPAPRAT